MLVADGSDGDVDPSVVVEDRGESEAHPPADRRGVTAEGDGEGLPLLANSREEDPEEVSNRFSRDEIPDLSPQDSDPRQIGRLVRTGEVVPIPRDGADGIVGIDPVVGLRDRRIIRFSRRPGGRRPEAGRVGRDERIAQRPSSSSAPPTTSVQIS